MNLVYDVIGEMSLPKNQWKPIPKSELDNYDEDILKLIQTAYAPIGGHPNYQNPKDVHSQNAEYEVIDLDHDDEIDAVSVHKKKQGNNKFTATGHDNTRPSKSAVVNHKTDKLKQPGYYIEVSGKIKDILLAKGVSPVTDEEMVRSMLKGKEIEWNGDGTYQREIAGKAYTKIMLGKPQIKENKTPNIMKKSQLKEMIKEEITTSLKEKRKVYRSSEFEEIMDACETISSNLYAFGDEGDQIVIQKLITQIEEYVEQEGFEEIDEGEGSGVDMGGDNPVVNAITKGAKAVGKGFKRFAKKMEPIGNAAAQATRRE